MYVGGLEMGVGGGEKRVKLSISLLKTPSNENKSSSVISPPCGDSGAMVWVAQPESGSLSGREKREKRERERKKNTQE